MNSLLNFLIEANICLVIFGAIYYLLLRKETDFNFRRTYLLLTVVLTLSLPLLSFNFFATTDLKVISDIPTTILPEFTVGEDSVVNENTNSNIVGYIPIFYGVIAFVVAQLFIFQLMQIAWFTFSNKTSIKKQGNTYLIYTNGTLPTFSFLSLLFFDNSVKLSSHEKAKIIFHEMVHINQFHSFDVILFEILKIMLWVNPFAWYFRKEIQDVHEYLADHAVIKNTDEQQYTSLLAKMALSKVHLALGHHFNKSKTLKRIEMMKTVKQKVRIWKTLLVAPLIGFTIFIVSCNDEVMQDIETTMETASQSEIPSDLKSKVNELQFIYPGADFAYIEVDGTSEEALKRLQGIDPKSIAHIKVYKERERIGILVNNNGPINRSAEGYSSEGGDVFTIVDEPAMPEGGYDSFYERLGSRLQYPKQARKLGIQGRVYVQFIVNEDGTLSDFQPIKGIGAGCDEAAVAALSQEKAWKAPMQRGKKVKQRIVLPITFKLGDGNPTSIETGKHLEIDDSK